MKHLLTLKSTERLMVLFALRAYIKWLGIQRPGKVPYMKMVYNKLKNSSTISVDGGEMLCLVEALRNRADVFFMNNRMNDQNYCISLSNYIDKQRQWYQYKNGPVIEKSS